jgi:hypothetical protein
VSEKTVKRANARTPVRANGSHAQRTFKREAFYIYEDQLDYLRRLAERETAAGRGLTISLLVREAIDAYIEKQRKK